MTARDLSCRTAGDQQSVSVTKLRVIFYHNSFPGGKSFFKSTMFFAHETNI